MISQANKPRDARQLKQMLFDADGKPKQDNIALFENACKEKSLTLSDFSIQDLAKAFLGQDTWRKRFEQLSLQESAALVEAGTPVSSTFFPQITSQLIFSEIRRQFDMEANVFTPLVPVIPSRIKGTEIVPSITNVDPDDMEDVSEGHEYPSVGVTEEYFTVPSKTKRGAKIELTREAITFDRTNMLVDQARAVGEALGASRENAIIDTLIGQVNNYSRNGTAANTYTTAGDVINNQSSLPLNDWTDVDTAMRLFEDILDPNTGEPLTLQPRHLIVMPAKLMTARRIISATEVRTSENATTGTRSEETLSPNPLMGMGLQLLSSIRLYRRVLAGPEGVAANAQQGWFLGDLSRLLGWYEVWPLQVFQQGPEHHVGFERDIEMRFKASYYGVSAVREKRFMLRLEDTAW